MRELFVYYKVASCNVADARAAFAQMQSQLQRAHPQLCVRLLRRPEEADGVQTWMETYSVAAVGVDAELQSAIDSAGAAMQPWTAGPRHTEVFIACAS